MAIDGLAELASTPVPMWLFLLAHPDLAPRAVRSALRRSGLSERSGEGSASE